MITNEDRVLGQRAARQLVERVDDYVYDPIETAPDLGEERSLGMLAVVASEIAERHGFYSAILNNRAIFIDETSEEDKLQFYRLFREDVGMIKRTYDLRGTQDSSDFIHAEPTHARSLHGLQRDPVTTVGGYLVGAAADGRPAYARGTFCLQEIVTQHALTMRDRFSDEEQAEKMDPEILSRLGVLIVTRYLPDPEGLHEQLDLPSSTRYS